MIGVKLVRGMKKLFIVIAMLLCSAGIFAQETTTVEKTVVAKEVNSIVNNTVDRAEEAITKLAAVLKVPAEHVYKVLVKQQIVLSIVNIFIAIFTIFFIIGTYKFFLYGCAPYRKDSDYSRFYRSDGGLQIIAAILTLISIIGLVYTIVSLGVTVAGFCNPEYGAMKDITNMLHIMY